MTGGTIRERKRYQRRKKEADGRDGAMVKASHSKKGKQGTLNKGPVSVSASASLHPQYGDNSACVSYRVRMTTT